jgi:putative aldouronate transport system permease protein
MATKNINPPLKPPLLERAVRRFKKEKALWLICGVALAWLIVFAYIPIGGIVIAFMNFIPGRALMDSPWVGLQHFRNFLALPDFMRILRNTLVISGLNLTIGFAAPIVFAILLNELFHKPFKRIVQTISYLPHFVSWVVVASIMTTLLGHAGIINELLLRFGFIQNAIPFLNSREMFWPIMITAQVWKGVGWSAIIYLGAMAGVDQELYQAGAVDGLGRLGRVWHITMPSILPIIILLFILGIGNILTTGFEYQLLLGTPLTRERYEVVDTFVVRYGIGLGRFSFAAAAGLMRSIIGFILVLTANWVSKKAADISII